MTALPTSPIPRRLPGPGALARLGLIAIVAVTLPVAAEEPGQAPGTALVPLPYPPPHLVTARALLGAITPETNRYTASPSRITWADEAGDAWPALNHSVCSSFGALVLRKCYGIDRAAAIALFGEEMPEADDFFAAMRDSGRFELAPTVNAIRAGDFLVINYLSNKAIPTGHVMLVDGPARRVAEHDSGRLPWPRPADAVPTVDWESATLVEWHVAVIDSSRSPHGEGDSRRGANADGTDDDGLGRGDLRILADPAGKMVGYTWSTSPRSRLRSAGERPILAGRYLARPPVISSNP